MALMASGPNDALSISGQDLKLRTDRKARYMPRRSKHHPPWGRINHCAREIALTASGICQCCAVLSAGGSLPTLRARPPILDANGWLITLFRCRRFQRRSLRFARLRSAGAESGKAPDEARRRLSEGCAARERVRIRAL